MRRSCPNRSPGLFLVVAANWGQEIQRRSNWGRISQKSDLKKTMQEIYLWHTASGWWNESIDLSRMKNVFYSNGGPWNEHPKTGPGFFSENSLQCQSLNDVIQPEETHELRESRTRYENDTTYEHFAHLIFEVRLFCCNEFVQFSKD